MVAYLNEHGYDKPINVQTLQSPAVKVYAGILEFLFRGIDPNFAFKGQHYEEEIPALFKAIDYPIQINKASLKVISQHDWPKLLGALTWLVELLLLDEQMSREKEEAALIDSEDAEVIFFEYLSEAYMLFMGGEDDLSPLDNKLAVKFEEKNVQIEEENAALERSMNVLQRDIKKLEDWATKLPELKKKKADLSADISKLNDFAANLEDYLAGVQRKLQGHETDLAGKKKRLEQLQKEKQALQKRLDAQEASGLDVRQMIKDRVELDEQVTALRSKREMAAKMMMEHEIQLGKQIEIVESEVAKYTELAMRLRLLPHSQNTKAESIMFDLQFKPHAKAEEMIGVDLRGTIKPSLKEIRAHLLSSVRSTGVECVRLREELDRLGEQLEQRIDEVALLESKVQEMERQCVAKKEALDVEQKQFRMAIKAVREETEAATRAMNDQLLESHKAVDELRMEENRLKSQFAQVAQQINNEIIDVVERLTTYKHHVQTKLRELKEETQRVSAELSQDAQRLHDDAARCNKSVFGVCE